MWERNHSRFFKGISKAEVWRIWADISNWPTWHGDLDYCKLDGEFEVGNHFMLKPKGMKAVKIDLIDVQFEKEFTDRTTFFGAKMYDTHSVEEADGGVIIRNKLVVKGPLKWLWIKLVAQHVADTISDEVKALVELCRRDHLKGLLGKITPVDEMEKSHLDDTLEWIQSGAPMYRIQKPDVPKKHLVTYFVLYDEDASKILLTDHIKAERWIPPGGHVDVGENPKEAAVRECFEELKIDAQFWSDKPIMLTSSETTGITAGHVDVSLWYVFKGNHEVEYDFDEKEFHSVRWFKLEDIPFEKAEPHMKRFICKLKQEVKNGT